MRILTVRQPWAWAIIHGGKDVENRSRNIAGTYHGPVAIHAALADDLGAWQALCKTSLAAWSRAMNARESLLSGVILGVVDLVDAHHVSVSGDPERNFANVCWDNSTPIGEACSPWAEAMVDGWHLHLANARPLSQPIPYKGALGLRELPADVAAEVLAGVAS